MDAKDLGMARRGLVVAVALAGDGGGIAPARRRRAARRRARPDPSTADAASARARASSTSSSGPATPSGATVDPAFDWVTPFEEETGCKVNTTDMTDSNNGVLAHAVGPVRRRLVSGDATTRLMAGGIVAPVERRPDPELRERLRRASRTGRTTRSTASTTACPHGRGPNLLMYNTDEVTPAPDQLGPVWDGGADYAARSASTTPSIYIADAALAPDDEAARARHHEPVPAQRRAVRRRPSSCSRPSSATRAPCTGAPYSDQVASYTAGDVVGRDDLAVPGQPAAGRGPADRRASCPTRARRAGPTPG